MKYPDDFINKVIQGDCLDELKKLPSNYIDLIVTDPPYGYSFMGKDWDKAVPSVEIWKECLRVLKPGGFAFIMSAPRSDVLSRMIVRVEDAGFRVDFTPIYWTYASGFPKAGDAMKLAMNKLGDEGKIVGRGSAGYQTSISKKRVEEGYRENETNAQNEFDLKEATDPRALALKGAKVGFQPKPAVEVIIVAMKPLSEKTYVDQALKNGKGVTWLDDCRVPTQSGEEFGKAVNDYGDKAGGQWQQGKQIRSVPPDAGRFPANLLVEDDILGDYSRFFSLDKWAENHPFLCVPKASKREKNEGLADMPLKNNHRVHAPRENEGAKTASLSQNHHPTVKPLKLMSYLITLGSREGDIVLDPFVGSGTTCVAAKKLSRKYTGIEFEKEYFDIAKARIEAQSELGKDTLF